VKDVRSVDGVFAPSLAATVSLSRLIPRAGADTHLLGVGNLIVVCGLVGGHQGALVLEVELEIGPTACQHMLIPLQINGLLLAADYTFDQNQPHRLHQPRIHPHRNASRIGERSFRRQSSEHHLKLLHLIDAY
jgi:hypothetical protein